MHCVLMQLYCTSQVMTSSDRPPPPPFTLDGVTLGTIHVSWSYW